jgi:hypothetical protein
MVLEDIFNMKLAVFGDSFGDDYTLWPNPYTGVGPSWSDFLRIQGIEVDNYAGGGASLFAAYQKFIANYQSYDKIIFVVTTPGRITVPMDNITVDWYSYSQARNELKYATNPARRTKLKAICDYFIHVKNDDYDNVTHKLMIKDILEKHDSVLMLPCFENSGIDGKIPLLKISEFEANFWNFKNTILPNSDTEYDSRKCHMCEENNLMLGQEVYNWVKTGNYNLTPDKFKTPTKEFSHYFRKHFKILLGER